MKPTPFDYLKSITKEAASFLLLQATLPIDLTKEDPVPTDFPSHRPILLIHGYLHHSSAFVYIRRQLTKAGIGPIYAINFGSPVLSIEAYAEKVRRRITYIAEATGCKEIDLIGHSMGGLIAVYYALHLAASQSISVTSIITLGTPFQGTHVASLGIGRCSKQMRHRSPFIKELVESMGRSDLRGTRYLHIGSATDLIVRPASSALPVHTQAHIKTFHSLGHISMLYSPRIAREIIVFYSTRSKSL